MRIKLSNELCMPTRAHPTDAGLDLKSVMDAQIGPGKQLLVDTGVSVAISPGFVGLVFSRSGQGNIGVRLANSVGVIDADYRGNIKVALRNDSETNWYIIEKYKTKIAQLVIVPIWNHNLVLWDGTDEEWTNSTIRGTNGFGSTGG